MTRVTEGLFFNSSRPELVIDPDPQTGHKFVKVRLRNAPPEIAHILTGEIIYHLRSSLDQIAVALGRLSVARPNVKKIYFPTGDRLKAFKVSIRNNAQGLDLDFIKLIIRLKPYDGGNDALRSIFRLGNIDKHLELIPAAASGNIAGINDFTIKDAIRGLILSGMQPLNEGITISELSPTGSITPNNSESQIKVAGQIIFGNVSIYNGKSIVGTLNSLVNLMESVLQNFTTHCRKTGRI
ncbi:MAG: hypothetical protein AAGL49_04940 [Pseudomonadota bacterium]